MLVILGGRLIDPARGVDQETDVVVENGLVSRIGRGAAAAASGPDVRVVSAKGCWVVPGLVDLHVHLREPGQEYKETIASGLKSAAAGGFTAVCAMPNTRPVNDTRATTEMIMARARQCRGTRLYPVGAITVDSKGEQITEMADLQSAGAIAVSDDGHCVMNAAVMRRAMEYARTFDLLVIQHCEDHTLTDGAQMHEGAVATRLGLAGWPRAAEEVIVARDLVLAELTGARYHVAHVSSEGTVRLLKEAKARGVRVSAEVTPHHLMLTHQALVRYETVYKVNPPLREEADRLALREALRDGVIDCIATDHAPHSAIEKDCEFSAASFGVIGLEQAVAVLLELVREGCLSPARFVEALSTAPARVAGIEGGSLREGARADLTVIDPNLRWTLSQDHLHSLSNNTPWLNKEVQGAVTMTVVGGQIAYRR
jgi:dihydroorotase